MALLIIYFVTIIVLLIAGLIRIIVAKDENQRKSGINLIVASVVMLLIGLGVCGIILASS